MADRWLPAAEFNDRSRKKGSKSKKQPSKRSSRLQFELLEKRDVLAAAVDVGADTASSEVMNASAMSMLFQQSALYSNGQPTADPTVTWTNRDEHHLAESHRTPAQQASEARDRIDMDTATERRRTQTSNLLPGLGARGTF